MPIFMEPCKNIDEEWETLPRIRNPDGTIKHVYRNWSRHHVISYIGDKMVCSEKDCEINKE